MYLCVLFSLVLAIVHCDNRPIQLGLFDTAGQEGFDRLRVLAYPGTDIFLVCFSVDSRTSFSNVEQVWVPEIRHNAGKDAKIVLIATKTDLRDCSQTRRRMRTINQSLIKEEEGREMCKRLQLLNYMECSAFTQNGLKSVFEFAANESLGVSSTQQTQKPGFLRKFLCWSHNNVE